jgi:hypothetical protein
MWAGRQTDGNFEVNVRLPAVALLKRLKNEVCLLEPIFRASRTEGWYDRNDYMESALLKKQLVITRSQFSLRNSFSVRSKPYHITGKFS